MSEEQFIPSNDLERALVKAAAEPSARADFYRRLIEADLFLLTPNTPKQEGTRVLEEDTPTSLVQWQGSEGVFIPVFSSMQILERAVSLTGRTYGVLAIKGQTAFEVLAQNPVEALLNPNCPCGKKLLVQEIRQLADGSIFQSHPRTVQKGTDWLLGQPAEYPHEIVEILRKLFEERRSIQAAYLAQMYDPKSGEPPHLLVGIESTQDIEAVVKDAGVAMRSALSGKTFVDFVQIGSGSYDDYLKTQTKPFYQRVESKPRWKFW